MLATPNRFFGASFMKLEMPALSPTMSEGTIVKWNIKEGGKVSVGDVICEIQTDKATVGFESQEEGYIAKILSGDGSTKVCGGLIGIMVEDKADISKIDLSGLQNETKKAETPVKEAPKASPEVAAASAPGTSSFFDELEHMLHGSKHKVSPAAGAWMRAYMVLPTEVKATGPKGYIIKEDVMTHISANQLVKGQRKNQSHSSTKQAAPASPAQKEKKVNQKKDPNVSPKFDPMNPFVQTWVDQSHSGDSKAAATQMHHQKRYVAHTYISSKVEVSNCKNASFEAFVLKASAKALAQVFPEHAKPSINRILSSGNMKVIDGANQKSLSSLSDAEVKNLNTFTNAPSAHLTVSQIDSSLESLPIASPGSLINLHFTNPTREVLPAQGVQTFDIDSLESEELTYDLKLITAMTSRISISYDVQKLDEMQAGQFL